MITVQQKRRINTLLLSLGTIYIVGEKKGQKKTFTIRQSCANIKKHDYDIMD